MARQAAKTPLGVHDDFGADDVSGEVSVCIGQYKWQREWPPVAEGSTDDGEESSTSASAGASSSDEEEDSEDDSLEFVVMGLTGDQLASCRCRATDTVVEAKRRVAGELGIPVVEQHFVQGNVELQDSQILSRCVFGRPEAVVHCVRVRRSSIACHLEAQGRLQDPDKASAASMADVADRVLQAEHRASERWRPEAARISRGVKFENRTRLVEWVTRSFTTLNLSDVLLHKVVLTLDRYFSRIDSLVDMESIQAIILAIVSLEMKLSCADEFPEQKRKTVLSRMAQGLVNLATVMRMERKVLARLDYAVDVPTPVLFVQEMCLRLREPAQGFQASGVEILHQCAMFLLEITLNFPMFLHGQPYVMLAAASLCAAARVLRLPDQVRSTILEDVASYGVETHDVERRIVACERTLLDLWVRHCTVTGQEEDKALKFVMSKFWGSRRCGVSLLSPTEAYEASCCEEVC